MNDEANGCSAGVPPAVAGTSRSRFGDVRVRNRGRLPHWETDGGLYFVTFRLADSLPKHVRDVIREHQRILSAARQSGRALVPAELELARQVSAKSIDRYLDAGSGSCALRHYDIAELTAKALGFWHDKRYRIHAWCIMPNHVHVVMRLFPGVDLDEIVGPWKSYTAKKANQLLRRSGSFWMREYYDRLIRDGAELDRAVAYVLANPGRSGLEQWRWVGTSEALP